MFWAGENSGPGQGEILNWDAESVTAEPVVEDVPPEEPAPEQEVPETPAEEAAAPEEAPAAPEEPKQDV